MKTKTDSLKKFAEVLNKTFSNFTKKDWLDWYRFGQWRIGELHDELREQERAENYRRCAAIKMIINEFYQD